MGVRFSLAGVVLFLSILASLGHGFFPTIPALPAGVLQLAVVALAWGWVPRSVKLVSSLLVLVGGLAMFVAAPPGPVWFGALQKNQAVIAMFTAVGFLRIVPMPAMAKAPPRGKWAVWQTMFSLNWFGAIVNMSAIVLFGDRLAGETRRLNRLQGMVLARGFAPAAIWSPFFVAMGIALTSAPGARITALVLWGLPISQGLLLLMAWYTGRSRQEVREFSGYPLSLEALRGPIVLMAAVMLAHWVRPDIPVLSIITLVVPLYALVVSRHPRGISAFAQHIVKELPRMGAEVTLFLAAGVLGTGLGALVTQIEIPFVLPSQDALSAALGLAIILVFAGIGVHPVVGISVIGALFSSAGIDPNLLAMSFLMGWSLGILINPFASVSMLLAGRYGYSFRLLWLENSLMVILGYVLCCVWLLIYACYSA